MLLGRRHRNRPFNNDLRCRHRRRIKAMFGRPTALRGTNLRTALSAPGYDQQVRPLKGNSLDKW